ncbi:MAG: decarboxylating 6-phosphogluconate dehydrogenase [Candidatus Doudnabacteria bacterium]|nr:decarboxylating 6-phosphogluconate dehydrogenase [Candidatus Doudnabacteria bacterium]
MKIAIFGLGKMGIQIARRLQKNNFEVLAWNRSPEPREEAAKAGVKTFEKVDELVGAMAQSPRIFWIMLPHEIVAEFIEKQIGPHLRAGDIVIDGGNSLYKESIKRAAELSAKGVVFYDCGTSGGVWGEENGFALMVGGPKEQWHVVEPIFKVLSSGENYGLMGKNGAGHFVKMVHNGIEYGMMEAIGEGYAVMQASDFNLDLKQVTKVYQQGSVVRSWLIDLVYNIFDGEDIAGTKGYIKASGEGEWTVNAGHELGVDVRVIEDSLKVRSESEDPANQNKFSNKIVALMRKQFGGHAIKK